MPKFYRITVERTLTLSRDITVAVPDGVDEGNVEEFLTQTLPGYDYEVLDAGNYDSVEDYGDISVDVLEEETNVEEGEEDFDLTDEEV